MNTRATLIDDVPFRTAIRNLRDQLERSFSPDTAASGFSGTAPSTGHCAAVSTIVNQVMGGELISAKVAGLSHWFNRVQVGGQDMDVDLTGDQFGFDAVQMAAVGELYPGTRVRPFADLNAETISRAILLAERSGLAAIARSLQKALEKRSLDAE